MPTVFTFKSQKVLKEYKNDPAFAEVMKDIANAKNGVVSFSKDVKKYMVEPLRAKYMADPDVAAVIKVISRQDDFASTAKLEIFKLQDESYFWYVFLQAYAIWKIIDNLYYFYSDDVKLMTLVRLIREDPKVFDEYPDVLLTHDELGE